MGRPSSYKTKQSEAILAYIASLGGVHTTAAQIVAYFEGRCAPIALTTVYRHLEKLTNDGKLHRYMVDGVSGFCYQHIDENEEESSQEHFHLKCEGCGTLIHLECGAIHDFQQHITEQHAFQINPVKTVLYGRCKACAHRG